MHPVVETRIPGRRDRAVLTSFVNVAVTWSRFHCFQTGLSSSMAVRPLASLNLAILILHTGMGDAHPDNGYNQTLDAVQTRICVEELFEHLVQIVPYPRVSGLEKILSVDLEILSMLDFAVRFRVKISGPYFLGNWLEH